MLLKRRIELLDEEGTTMVELLVGLAMGMVVIVGLTMTIIVVLHGNARVDARVEATDNARLVMTRITEELHSACIRPQIAPIREESTSNSLIFWHAAAGHSGDVAPEPVKTRIYWENNGTLKQIDMARTGGTEPANWTFQKEAEGTRTILLSNVAPAGKTGVFTYEAEPNGTVVELTASKLTGPEAETVIVVKAAVAASPKSAPVADAGATAVVKSSATLRLTPPSFNPVANASPCQ
jgi:Tfp pilus assembly protein PilW